MTAEQGQCVLGDVPCNLVYFVVQNRNPMLFIDNDVHFDTLDFPLLAE